MEADTKTVLAVWIGSIDETKTAVSRQSIDDAVVTIGGAMADFGGELIGDVENGVVAEFTELMSALKCAESIKRQLSVNSQDLLTRAGVCLAREDTAPKLSTILASRPEGHGIVASPGVNGLLKYNDRYTTTRLDAEVDAAIDEVYCVESKPGKHLEDGSPELRSALRRNAAFSIGLVALLLVVATATWQSFRYYSFDPSPLSEQFLEIPDRPSIVVLPFDNLSANGEQAYFADGMTEDLTAGLSKFSGLFVISRNTAFSFRDSGKTVPQIAEELGVQFVLEGSVRLLGEELRVNAQLVEGTNDRQIWSQTFDRKLDDIFAIQDELTGRIVGSVAPEIESETIAKTLNKQVQHLDTWELISRGTWHIYRFTSEDSRTAEKTLKLAIAASNDPSAYARLGFLYANDALYAWHRPQGESLNLAYEAARRAIEIDPTNSRAHSVLGGVLYLMRRHKEAILALETAIEINPNFSFAHGLLGVVLAYMREPERARSALETALRLSPRDPYRGMYFANYGMTMFNVGNYEQATPWFLKAVHETPRQPSPFRGLTANYGMLGDLEAAKKALEDLNRLVPNVTISDTRNAVGFVFQEDEDRFLEGLRRAGMPE